MMRLKSAAVLVLLCLFSAACAEEAAAPDTRLDQKVTYQAKGTLLHVVLEELSEKTDVAMTAGMNAGDWKVRDRKVALFVTDMKLDDVQKTLAKLLRFTWARGKKDGVHTYRLFQDLKSRKEEEALLAGSAEAEAKKLAEKRTGVIDQIEQLDKLSPEEIAKLKDESPFLYVMATEPFGKSLGQMLTAIPDARAAFTDGRDVNLPLSKMTQHGVNATEGLITGLDELVSKLDIGHNNAHTKLLNNLSQAEIKMKLSGEDMPEEARQAGMIGMIQVTAPNSERFDMPIFDPTSHMANMIAKAMIMASEGQSPESIKAQMMADSTKLFSQPPTVQAEDDLPKDNPALDKEIKLEAKDPSMPAVLETLAKEAKTNVVSDYFIDARSPRMSQTTCKLRDALKLIAATYGKQVKYSEGLITFEDPKWYEKRSWEVPEAWLETWRTRAKEGKFTFDDLVSVACLTDGQIQHTILAERKLLPVMGFGINRSKNVLRLYAALTPGQKTALQTQSGINVSTLSDAQWPYFAALEPSVAKKLTTPQTDKQEDLIPCYALRMEVDEKTKSRQFMLTLSWLRPDGTVVDPAHVDKTWQVSTPQNPKPAAAPTAKP